MDSLKDVLVFAGIFGGYLILVTWILPKLGVPT